MYLNDCKLLGRIATVPESKYTPNKKHAVNFVLAVPRYRKDDGTDYVEVVVWNHAADFVDKYLNKGDMVIVEGRLAHNVWTDKNTEEKRSRVYIDGARIIYSRIAKSNMNGQGESTFGPVYNDDEYDFPY